MFDTVLLKMTYKMYSKFFVKFFQDNIVIFEFYLKNDYE